MPPDMIPFDGEADGAPLDVVVIHETNGAKYFEALLFLQRTGRLRSLRFYEASVLWKFVHSLLRERKSVAVAAAQSWRNLRFRLSCWTLRRHVVLLGVAPWDIRLLLYARLRRDNALVYHTSWPQWDAAVPRRYGALTPWLRRAWLRILRETRVAVAAATGLSGESAAAAIGGGKPVTVIRHVVSEVFFAQRARHATPFRLLFLGELSDKKGLPELRRMMDLLADAPVVLDIVGDGPLRAMAAEMANRPGCVWHGHVRDRAALAAIVGRCQMLVSPAVRTGRWEELFGIAIIEAMASGLPCIASDHIGPRSIITSGIDGILLPERAPVEMAAEVRRLAGDPAAWEAMSAAAARTARDYSLRETAARWERLFRAGAHGAAAPGAEGATAPGPQV
jgi:glycosyltransferase involved in cell wall biosynthesis